jgi:hypothetical protein
MLGCDIIVCSVQVLPDTRQSSLARAFRTLQFDLTVV